MDFFECGVDAENPLIGLEGHLVVFEKPTPYLIWLQSPLDEVPIFEFKRRVIAQIIEESLDLRWGFVTLFQWFADLTGAVSTENGLFGSFEKLDVFFFWFSCCTCGSTEDAGCLYSCDKNSLKGTVFFEGGLVHDIGGQFHKRGRNVFSNKLKSISQK